MANRGRPPKNGVQNARMFYRAMLALCAYNEARRAGEKHSEAIKEAVTYIQSRVPELLPMCQTEVRRIVSRLQPKSSAIAFSVRRAANESPGVLQVPAAVRQKLGWLDNVTLKEHFTFGFGSRPVYERHNSKDSNQKEYLPKYLPKK